MIVRVEGAKPEYKGPKEFENGQIILDVSIRTMLLPQGMSELPKFVPYPLHIRGIGVVNLVDVNLEVQERSLLMKGLARKRTQDAPPQTIYVSESMAAQSFPVFVRHEGIPYDASLKFDISKHSSNAKESEAVKFVKQFK